MVYRLVDNRSPVPHHGNSRIAGDDAKRPGIPAAAWSLRGVHLHLVHHHGHTHGIVDPSILTTGRGIRAVKWSFVGMFITAFIPVIIVYYSGSIALLADTIHNFGDALTAIPLLFAFMLARWKPTQRFTYGYGRVEDLAGVFMVLMILISAIVAGYVSIDRLFHPQEVTFLWAVAAAALIGFIGNEAVAQLRIRVGTEIGSAALVADGYHARTGSRALRSLSVQSGSISGSRSPTR